MVQDTFLQVLKTLPSFRGQSHAYTWIYRIAVNASLKVKKELGGAEWLDSLDERIEESREDVPDEVQQWYADRAKAVYVMRDILEFSCQETAEVLEISEGAHAGPQSGDRPGLRRLGHPAG